MLMFIEGLPLFLIDDLEKVSNSYYKLFKWLNQHQCENFA